MRVNAANDIDFGVWPKLAGARVMFRVGWARFTATPDEAAELARQLIAAVDALREARDEP